VGEAVLHPDASVTVVSDNGTELTSNAILRWADDLVAKRTQCAPEYRQGVEGEGPSQ
jgi:hypothetical protein